MDKTAARYINDNFTDYLVAVNADVDQLDVILIPEQDDRVNPAGIKGLGELGNVGTAADCQRRAPCHRATYSRPADSDRANPTSAVPPPHAPARGGGPLYKPPRRCLGASHQSRNQGYDEENDEHPE